MYAAIDIGSNTVRMLVGESSGGQLQISKSWRRITRLAGQRSADGQLSAASMARSLTALEDFSNALKQFPLKRIRAVATEALRRAPNGPDFVRQVAAATGLEIEIISGDEEARLMTAGTLSVVDPLPQQALLFDIGGGSTELVFYDGQQVHARQSFPLGVVQLAEQLADPHQRRCYIERQLSPFFQQPQLAGRTDSLQLIGTAGTMTTLAALHLQLEEYLPGKINNHCLSVSYLEELHSTLEGLSVAEREQLPGMEKGRGDLILPGLAIVLWLLQRCNLRQLKVADAGLMEGVLLDLAER